MPRKPKFRPVITRVKLNPEQAVLTCLCHTAGHKWAFRTDVVEALFAPVVMTCSVDGGSAKNVLPFPHCAGFSDFDDAHAVGSAVAS